MVIPGRMVALGVAALLLVGAGVAVAVTRDRDTKTEAGAPPAVDQPEVTTSTEPTTTTSTVTATSTPPTTGTTSPPTTARRSTATTATTAARVTTTTTTAPAVPVCTQGEVAATIVTDRPSYAPGQEVKLTSTLRNKSSATCFYNGYGFTSAFKNEAGGTLSGSSVIADSFADVPLRPGQTIAHSASWDHRLCPEPACGPQPPGPYTALATWKFARFTYEVSTTFILS